MIHGFRHQVSGIRVCCSSGLSRRGGSILMNTAVTRETAGGRGETREADALGFGAWEARGEPKATVGKGFVLR
jgi:hypothetical protein